VEESSDDLTKKLKNHCQRGKNRRKDGRVRKLFCDLGENDERLLRLVNANSVQLIRYAIKSASEKILTVKRGGLRIRGRAEENITKVAERISG